MRSYKPRVVGTNLQGYAVGQDNPAARHPDSLVAEVRAMQAGGMSLTAISEATGVRPATVGRWCRGERRAQAPARFISRPAGSKAFTLNPQPDPAEPAPARVSGPGGLPDTVNLTVKKQP